MGSNPPREDLEIVRPDRKRTGEILGLGMSNRRIRIYDIKPKVNEGRAKDERKMDEPSPGSRAFFGGEIQREHQRGPLQFYHGLLSQLEFIVRLFGEFI